MKRLWLACFAVAAVTASASTANAQFNQSPEIGSYQSILARTVAPPEKLFQTRYLGKYLPLLIRSRQPVPMHLKLP